MNEQTRKAIDRARLVLKAAPNPMSEFYAVSSVYVQPGVMATLCDALEVAHTREANALTACLCGRRGQCVWCRVEDHRLCAEAAERRAEEAEARDAHNRAEVERVIGPTLAAMKRAGIDSLPDATEELIRRLDAAEAEVTALRNRAGIAEGREAAAKANAEQMAGWLDARNAGLVQMARERDALREKLAAVDAKAARMVARVCAGCHGRGVAHLDGGSPRCAACGGAGAVIVETGSGG